MPLTAPHQYRTSRPSGKSRGPLGGHRWGGALMGACACGLWLGRSDGQSWEAVGHFVGVACCFWAGPGAAGWAWWKIHGCGNGRGGGGSRRMLSSGRGLRAQGRGNGRRVETGLRWMVPGGRGLGLGWWHWMGAGLGAGLSVPGAGLSCWAGPGSQAGGQGAAESGLGVRAGRARRLAAGSTVS